MTGIQGAVVEAFVQIPLNAYLDLLEDREDLTHALVSMGQLIQMVDYLEGKLDVACTQNENCGQEIQRLTEKNAVAVQCVNRACDLADEYMAKCQELTEENQKLALALAAACCLNVGF